MTELPLNQGQQDAADGFYNFLFDETPEMGITGPGGTGKTFLMGHMIDKIIPQYQATCRMMGIDPLFDSVDMTATTNKAAEVLGNDCNRPTSTLPSFLNLKVQDDFKTGKSKLIKTERFCVHERKILFVDECSMVDTPMRNITHEGLSGSKIVWVGDHCQMAPVMEKISPVFNSGIKFYELTQPMRTTVPELQALNLQLRNQVEEEQFYPIEIVPGIIDWFTDEQMEAAIAAEFSSINMDARILAFTNRRVQEFNHHIRDLRGLPTAFTIGEKLVNNTATRLRGRMLSVEEEVEIVNIHANIKDILVDTYDGEEVRLEYFEADIRDSFGSVYQKVQIPMDSGHFAMILKWLASHKKFGMMYNLKAQLLDLRQRDASTVYKAQGSSIDTVYIDAANISTCNNPAQAARMLYVAASRARKRVVFYGELAAKYGGFKL